MNKNNKIATSATHSRNDNPNRGKAPNGYYQFSVQAFSFAENAANDGKRLFEGVANSGKPFDYWGVPHIIDFNGIQFKERVPVLREHDREQIAGVASLFMEGGVLKVRGELFSNEHGQAIIDAADNGFPWELSVDCRPSAVSHLRAGQQLSVNGIKQSGEMTVLRGVLVREVSFCATGADSNTHAKVFSEQTNKDLNMDLEQALAEIDRLTQENAALKQQVDEQKAAFEEEKAALQNEIDKLKGENNQADTDAQLSAAGFIKQDDGKFARLSDTTYNMLLSADKATRTALIGDLKPSSIPPHLLSDDGDGQSVSGSLKNPLIENAKNRKGV